MVETTIKWHTGTPERNGYYLVYKVCKEFTGFRIDTVYYNLLDGKWRFHGIKYWAEVPEIMVREEIK